MTLRERIAELENDLAEGRYGSTMHDAGSAREFVCENLKRHLDETANADAEQARLAGIGTLVEAMLGEENSLKLCRFEDGTYTALTYVPDGHLGYEKIIFEGRTLISALEALSEKVKE